MGTKPAEKIPAEQPVEPAVATTKKSNKKLPVIIICTVLGLGIITGTAFAITNMVNSSDPVTRAFAKIFRGELPKRIAVKGDVNATFESSIVTPIGKSLKSIGVGFDGKADFEAKTGDATITLSATVAEYPTLSISASSRVSADKEIYAKIGGVKNLFNTIMNVPGVSTSFNSSTKAMILTIINLLDDTWIEVPTETISSFLPSSGESISSSILENALSTMPNSECLVSNIKDFYVNDFAKLYTENPFISATATDNSLYRLGIDSQKAANYISALYENEAFKNVLGCVGGTLPNPPATIEATYFEQLAEVFPTILVAVDNDNFTKLSFSYNIDEVNATIVGDFSFSYPTSIEVNKPESYKDLSEIMQLPSGGSGLKLTF